MSAIRSTVLSLAALTVSATFAGAQEYCVACTEPNALYRCIIDDARPGTAPSLQVVCISRIAKEGGHGQCAVKRGVTVFECDGVVKRISMATEPPTAPQGPPVTATPAPAAPQPTAPKPAAAPADEPPKTLAEVAKRAKADSDRQMEKAGSFFKKSLGCIASLFTKCSGDEQ